MNVCPAIVSVPVRLLEPVFAATEYSTVPLPLPLLPDVIVIQLTLLAAVQVQPVPAVTATLPVAAVAVRDRLAGATVYVQPATSPLILAMKAAKLGPAEPVT